MPQATRTRTHTWGRRYSHDLTRNLMRTDREEGTMSPGAYIEMPPVTCDALATPVTCISMLARPAKPGKDWYQAATCRPALAREGWTAGQSPGWRCCPSRSSPFCALVSV